jgi:hypothetical protein
MFTDRGVSRSQGGGTPRAVGFLNQSRFFFFQDGHNHNNKENVIK